MKDYCASCGRNCEIVADFLCQKCLVAKGNHLKDIREAKKKELEELKQRVAVLEAELA